MISEVASGRGGDMAEVADHYQEVSKVTANVERKVTQIRSTESAGERAYWSQMAHQRGKKRGMNR